MNKSEKKYAENNNQAIYHMAILLCDEYTFKRMQ